MTTADGKTLLHMRSWAMLPETPEVTAADAGEKGHKMTALFDSPQGEHYYGLGQQQKGWMDLRDHEIHCWHSAFYMTPLEVLLRHLEVETVILGRLTSSSCVTVPAHAQIA